MAECVWCKNDIKEAQYMLMDNEIYKSCPGCSTKSEEHIFYKCPEFFGFTAARITKNNPIGLQSHCVSCRGGKEGPHDHAVKCEDIKTLNGYIINEVRLLPMSSAVFPTIEDVNWFLLETMPERGNTYYFGKSKMNAPENTLVFFQYSGSLLGYAVLKKTNTFDTPKQMGDGIDYIGYYEFFENTFTLFDKPISAQYISSIYAEFKGFNQSHQILPKAILPAVFKEINASIKTIKPEMKVSLPEEISETDIGKLKEGAQRQIVVNAYERNPQARKACISHYKKLNNGEVKCEICGFNFGKQYGLEFSGKIHIHHIVEISSIGEEYEVDAVKDLIPVCPNCHMVIHSKKPPYTPDEVKAMLKK